MYTVHRPLKYFKGSMIRCHVKVLPCVKNLTCTCILVILISNNAKGKITNSVLNNFKVFFVMSSNNPVNCPFVSLCCRLYMYALNTVVLYIHRVSLKNWTLSYSIIFLFWQLQIASKFPEVHRRCCLLWIWNKCLWLISYVHMIIFSRFVIKILANNS